MTTVESTSVKPARDVKARRLSFEFDATNLPKHFMSGDLVMSHIIATLSAYFPPGEDFFVASVRNYRDKITDPVLKKQVAGFIGQEAVHSREHDVLNRLLSKAGYRTESIERGIRRGLTNLGGRFLPKPIQLAITAALEHYTATLAQVLMTSEEAREMFADPEVRNLLLWHALEESEHKAVAFDVYQQCVGDQQLRIRVMKVMTILFIGSVGFDALISALMDKEFYLHPTETVASFRRLKGNPWLTDEVKALIGDYNRPDFHPDDHETDELLAFWAEKLFGADGALVSRLKSAAA